MPRISHSYYVVMVDYGRRGLEAVVQPEQTRRDIIEMIQHGEFKNIAFIHHVDGLYIEDVTMELMEEAEGELRTFAQPDAVDAVAAKFDHDRDLRKHDPSRCTVCMGADGQ